MSLREWLGNHFYNDLPLLPVYLMAFLVALLVLAIAVWFHEFGHWFWFKVVKKKNIKIRFIKKSLLNFSWEAGTQEDYKDLTEKQYKNMLICGIAFGLIPIILATAFWTPFLLMVFPYGVGVWQDLKILLESSKLEELEDV